jgi:hypothetical protein
VLERVAACYELTQPAMLERRPTQAEEGDSLRGQENHAEGRPSIAMCGSNWISEASSDNDPNVELVVIRMLEAGMNAGSIYSTKCYTLGAGQRRNMRVFKTKWFARWADNEGVADAALRGAVEEMSRGLIDANLGGHVFKKRVGIEGRGKRGGLRTLLAFRVAERAFFVFGFAKNERANVSDKELVALKLLGSQLLGYGARTLSQALRAGELHEVESDE